MGLFSGLKKIAGKVLKAGLSVATRGVSDKVLAGLKSFGKKPATIAAKPPLYTEQEEALLNKLGQATPRVRQSEVYANVRAGGATLGSYKSKTGYKRKRSTSRMTYSDEAPAPRPRKKRRASSSSSTTGKRKPPPGGLDLRAMAGAWRAAGKPGTWLNWIKTQPIRRA
jgi:hypothetical protein